MYMLSVNIFKNINKFQNITVGIVSGWDCVYSTILLFFQCDKVFQCEYVIYNPKYKHTQIFSCKTFNSCLIEICKIIQG